MKKYLVFCLSIIMIVGTSVFAFAGNISGLDNHIDMFKEAEAIKIVLNSDKVNPSYKIAEIYGSPVYEDEFILRYRKAVASQSSTPYEDAVESLTKIKVDNSIAENNGILPTEQDVENYTNEQRKLYENEIDAEMKDSIKHFIDLTGMSEDEYWGVYKLKENKEYLTCINVESYLYDSKVIQAYTKSSSFELIDENFSKENIDTYLNSII
ncbi:hypothetical protein [Sinanaerobacter sp. ZZT-01]|uniref:hypothetical protein n=1 Tax=Sinanaerobacter sp. ZZT-01 TaxID=3111540 RepID=UPI002D78DE57|nr:hypothetical protein [Sinanaerobacter sp. ZZT-01]WRR94386.1 hypothetical protein U5921_04520 [Sinanaerobacter sp. ZZT-01]